MQVMLGLHIRRGLTVVVYVDTAGLLSMAKADSRSPGGIPQYSHYTLLGPSDGLAGAKDCRGRGRVCQGGQRVGRSNTIGYVQQGTTHTHMQQMSLAQQACCNTTFPSSDLHVTERWSQSERAAQVSHAAQVLQCKAPQKAAQGTQGLCICLSKMLTLSAAMSQP